MDSRKSSNQENQVNHGSDRKNVWSLIIRDYGITMILYTRIQEIK